MTTLTRGSARYPALALNGAVSLLKRRGRSSPRSTTVRLLAEALKLSPGEHAPSAMRCAASGWLPPQSGLSKLPA